MPLTITVTLEDDVLQEFIDQYNDDAGVPLTYDMVLQNQDFKNAVAEDMVSEWLHSLHDTEEYASPYDMYSEFFDGPPADEEVFVGDSDHEHDDRIL